MKLEDWVRTVAKGDIWQFEIMKGLHVIGTCKDCKHWNKYTTMWSGDNLEHRSCDEIDKYVSPVDQRYGSVPREDFGCIHWEGKEID